MTKEEKKPHGELRQDIVSGRWVVVAPARGKRPSDYKDKKAAPDGRRTGHYVESCPFCNFAEYPQEREVLRLPDDVDDWQVHVFGNKYPAFVPGSELSAWHVGPHRALQAVGYHEILATRAHNSHEALASQRLFEMNLEALVRRYRQLRVQPSVNYIQIIKNYGPAGGASLVHPHHQIFTTPVLPVDVSEMLRGVEAYQKAHQHNVFVVMLEFEQREGVRIVSENEHFVALCPFASRVPFQVWVVPRQPAPFFENIDMAGQEALAQIMRDVLQRLYVGLNDPSYNYLIHSAPCDDTGFVCDAAIFEHFSWHVQIFPRLETWGGFELGTGLEINSVLPEEAAEYLRAVDVGGLKTVS